MNIYVSNLDFKVEDNDLKDFFTPFGNVISARVILDRESNRSRGFGFVDMPDKAAGDNAISNLNGSLVEGRAISVAEAKPKESQGGFKSNMKKSIWK